MGDVEKTVKILFQGDDQSGSAIASIQKSLDGLGTAAKDVGSGLEDIGQPFADAAGKVALLEVAILGLAAAGLKARADLEGEAAKMGDALDLPIEKIQEFEDVAKNVYSSGFGGTLEESFGAVTVAAQKFKDETSAGIESIVTNANKIKTTFGVDVSESLSAVKSLMDNFGLSSEQAFDFVVAGYQKGLNGSGDFLESINEYSTQFANGGADAGQFFSVLESGFQEGLLGTDKAADAFKEFRVRIQDGSTTTQDALNQLGLGEPFLNSLATGKITAIEAFDVVVQKLNETNDSSVVMQAGVGLMGTQFEDLGTKAALSLSTTATNLDDIAGKIADINPDESLGTKFDSMMKTIVTAITGDDIWKGIENDLKEIFDGFKDNFVAAWESLDSSDFDPLLSSFDGLMESIKGIFDSAGIDLSSVEGIKTAIQDVIDTVSTINNISSGMADAFSPILGAIADLIRKFNEIDPGSQAFIGSLLAVGTAIGGLGTALAAGGAFLGGLSSLAGFLSSGGALTTGLGAVVALLTGPAGLVVALGAAALAVLGFSMSKMGDEAEAAKQAIEAQTQTIDELTDQINALPANVPTLEIYAKLETGDYDAAKQMIDDAVAEQREFEVKAAVEQQEFDDFYAKLVEAGNLDQTEIELIANTGSLTEATNALSDLEKDRSVNIKADVDTKQATETLTFWTETGGTIEIEVPVDTKDLEKTKKDIEAIPSEKQLEIKLQGDIDTEIARIKASAETAEAAFKYTAEVDIAEIEAQAKVAQSAFEAIGTSVSSATDSVASMFDSLTSAFSDENLTQLQKWSLQDLVEEQQDAQNKLIDSQVALNDAQVEYMKARTEALEKGDSLITIESNGLEPALEMVMWEIIKKVQVRANEEAADFLLGI